MERTVPEIIPDDATAIAWVRSAFGIHEATKFDGHGRNHRIQVFKQCAELLINNNQGIRKQAGKSGYLSCVVNSNTEGLTMGGGIVSIDYCLGRVVVNFLQHCGAESMLVVVTGSETAIQILLAGNVTM